MSRRDVLLFTMEETYGRLRDRLEGLTEEEFFWKPVADAWTIYEDRPGHWTYHYEIPDPDPAPVTTVAWQVTHLATTRFIYREWAYGGARLSFPELIIPNTVEGAIEFLHDGYDALRADLENETDESLDKPRKTNWGGLWPAWRIFSSMIDHDALHTGTIGGLRDLYYWVSRAPDVANAQGTISRGAAQSVYADEVLQHRRRVARLINRVRAQLEQRAATHDESKFDPQEVALLANSDISIRNVRYGSAAYRRALQAVAPAAEHHYAANRHHPEHFAHGIEEMNLIDLIEMVCDWCAAAEENDASVMDGMNINVRRFKVSRQLAAIIRNTLEYIDENRANRHDDHRGELSDGPH